MSRPRIDHYPPEIILALAIIAAAVIKSLFSKQYSLKATIGGLLAGVLFGLGVTLALIDWFEIETLSYQLMIGILAGTTGEQIARRAISIAENPESALPLARIIRDLIDTVLRGNHPRPPEPPADDQKPGDDEK